MNTLTQYQARLSDFWQACPEDQQIAALRHLCRTDLYFLLRHGLGRKDIEKQWLFDRCQEVQAGPDGYLDLWSREHYKSAIITYAKTIQDILASHGDDPLPEWGGREVTVGIFSHTRGIAKRFLRQIKFEFEQNPLLKEWFPDVLFDKPDKQSPKWSEDEGIVVKRKSNPAEATVEAWGVVDGQPIGKHFFLLVYDDIVVPESVTSPDMMQKTSDMLALSFALGAEGGRRRFIGTRYHQNDAYKTVIDRGTANPRIHLLTKDGTADGEPVLRSKEWVAEKRRDMGPYIFSCQMLQNPSADESQGFKPDWLKYHDGIKRDGMNIILVFDPAGSKGKRNDYTAGWVVGLGPDENVYILDMVRDRMNLTQRAALVMNWHKKYKPMREHGVRYEKYGLMADIEHINTIQAATNYRFDITEVGGQISKIERIKRLVPYFEQGRIYLPRSLHYTGSDGKTTDLVHDFIEQEYKSFPVPVHDDMLDALARMADPDYPLIFPQLVEYSQADLEPATYED
ncbi:MAG: phage terminase large subunit [Polaromonas sp.]|nr:phage terminase large subunit [Polaromonas sp.]